MTEKKVVKKVLEITCERLGLEKGSVTVDSAFTKDLAADSLSLVELIMSVEDEFDIDIPEEACEKFSTVSDIVAFVKKTVK